MDNVGNMFSNWDEDWNDKYGKGVRYDDVFKSSDENITTKHEIMSDDFLNKLDDNPELAKVFFNKMRKRKLNRITDNLK